MSGLALAGTAGLGEYMKPGVTGGGLEIDGVGVDWVFVEAGT